MRHPFSLFLIALISAVNVVVGAIIFSEMPATSAQAPSPEQRALQVYEQIPQLPRVNQYQHRESREVAQDNTLVSRFIRYHLYNKGRSPNYRLDWKITLADYLGANDYMDQANYPGAAYLKPNPMEADLAAIRNLSRSDRDQLVQTLVNVFAPPTSPDRSPSLVPPTPQTREGSDLPVYGQEVPPLRQAGSASGLFKAPTAPADPADLPQGDARFLWP
ncbi:hypothetical protein [Lyngbya confervoides]|uniref:Uncharacterized protein n=1 Tax=Lyngbya confervoides BDU141951 TaxID=1574623 RepID=A0ABD4T1C3_9CYAN|nr:hypothetical protein [Lyngbya confervoides]MCM1982283.1 hypothetical protein [Lyngbya confervoides BDU141951]